MQALTGKPRDGLTDDAVRSLLTADDLEVSAGCELLDTSNRVVEDISDDLMGGEIQRDNRADVHGTVSLEIARRLAWGKDRVRPYMVLSSATTTARFNLGVFVLTSPEEQRGEDPIVYTVDGYDLLHLLQDGPGDTYVIAAGTTYFDAVRQVVTDSKIGAPFRLDGTLQATAIPNEMVWALTDGGVTWLRILNDLLAAINYRGVWADQDGTLRSEPYTSPANRPIEWTFDTADLKTDLIDSDRTLAEDVWSAPNHWRFVRSNMDHEPTEGDGLYTVVNQSDGPTSIDSLGRTRRKVVFLDVADQAALEAAGDKTVTEDRAITRTFTLSVDPLPIAGHFDVVRLRDSGTDDKCQVTSWSIPLDGSRGSWEMEAVNG